MECVNARPIACRGTARPPFPPGRDSDISFSGFHPDLPAAPPQPLALRAGGREARSRPSTTGAREGGAPSPLTAASYQAPPARTGDARRPGRDLAEPPRPPHPPLNWPRPATSSFHRSATPSLRVCNSF